MKTWPARFSPVSFGRSHRPESFSTETRHGDSSLIRANDSMDARVSRQRDAVDEANDAERDGRRRGKSGNLCRTGPDPTMATSSKARLTPGLQAAHSRG